MDDIYYDNSKVRIGIGPNQRQTVAKLTEGFITINSSQIRKMTLIKKQKLVWLKVTLVSLTVGAFPIQSNPFVCAHPSYSLSDLFKIAASITRIKQSTRKRMWWVMEDVMWLWAAKWQQGLMVPWSDRRVQEKRSDKTLAASRVELKRRRPNTWRPPVEPSSSCRHHRCTHHHCLNGQKHQLLLSTTTP